MTINRIVIHWTAGTHNVSDLDRQHYHFIIDGDGRVHRGDKTPEDNLSTQDGVYAAHTKSTNTGAIGISVAAMAGAVERPFSAGKYPIKPAQIAAMVRECARLCKQYDIPVTKTQVLTHAEVQPTLGIKQNGKWDITWLPGMAVTGDPVIIGNTLRKMIYAEMTGPGVSTTNVPPKIVITTETSAKPAKAPVSGLWLSLLHALTSLFHRAK